MKNNKTVYSGLLFMAIMFTSLNLRAPIASVGSLVVLMEGDLVVSKSAIGFITTLPPLAFAFSALFIPKIAQKLGTVNTLIYGSCLIGIGAVLRSSGGYLFVLIGTLILSIGIAAGNVLLPATIKSKVRIPAQIGLFTGLYLAFQNLCASFAAGFSYPIAVSTGIGWRGMLSVWVFIAILAVLFWFLFKKIEVKTNIQNEAPIHINEEAAVEEAHTNKNLLKSKLAWYITMIMGLQSICYFVLTAWLPTILQNTNMSPELSGLMALCFQLTALPVMFLTPIVISKVENKAIVAFLSGLLYFVGIIGLIFANSTIMTIISLMLLSLGNGTSFSWVVAMIALVTKDARESARLSGMTQVVGYMMSATGPIISGFIVDLTGSWTNVLLFTALMAVLIMLFGLLSKGKKL